MKNIKQMLLALVFLALPQGLIAADHAAGSSLKSSGSADCKKQKEYADTYEKSKPAFYALMAYLCDWSPPLLPWKITQFKGLWSKIASGKSLKLTDIKKFEELQEAKSFYDSLSQNTKDHDLPIISLSPAQALDVMSEQGDLSLLNSKQLNFYLKIFDCNFEDANTDSISGNAFAQLWSLDQNTGAAIGLHQNASAILQKVLELEVEYQGKSSKKAKAGTCEESFSESPLSIFSKAIMPRLDEELSVYPASQAAVQMRQALRDLIPQVDALKNETSKSQVLASLSKIIADVEKRFPKK